MLTVAASMALYLWRTEGNRDPDRLKQAVRVLNALPVFFIPVSWAGCRELTCLLPRSLCQYEVRTDCPLSFVVQDALPKPAFL